MMNANKTFWIFKAICRQAFDMNIFCSTSSSSCQQAILILQWFIFPLRHVHFRFEVVQWMIAHVQWRLEVVQCLIEHLHWKVSSLHRLNDMRQRRIVEGESTFWAENDYCSMCDDHFVWYLHLSRQLIGREYSCYRNLCSRNTIGTSYRATHPKTGGSISRQYN